MKGVLAACSPYQALSKDGLLIYSLFRFHLITVTCILSIPLTFLIYFSKSFLVCKMHLRYFNIMACFQHTEPHLLILYIYTNYRAILFDF